MVEYLFRWITRYQLLAFVLAIALVIILGNAEGGLGLPALFWCRPGAGMVAIGFAVASLFALISFTGFLLDHRNLGLKADKDGLHRYFNRTIWLPTVLVVGRGVARSLRADERCGNEWMLLLGYVIGLLFVKFAAPLLASAAKAIGAKAWFQKLIGFLAKLSGRGAVTDHWLHAYAFLIVVTLTALYATFAVWIAPVNSGVSLSILLAMVVLVYGAVRFFIPRATLIVLVVLVAWIFFANQVPRKHRFELMKDVPVRDLASPVARNEALIPDEVALNAWRAQLLKAGPVCGDTAKPKMIVVMTSGGGIRASAWTAAVLRELQEHQCRFAPHIRVITGASGGMVGAGFYVAARSQRKVEAETDVDLKAVTADGLDNVAKYLALRDVPALFIPAAIPDRGFALEEAWRRDAPPMRRQFIDLAAYERAGTLPSLIYAAASLDDGRRLLISNLQLDYMSTHTIGGRTVSHSAIQFFELFPGSPVDVATFARMQASFPWVSSAAELPTKQLRRIADAGYVDNYGGFVIAAWLEKNRDWLKDNTSGVLVVQIRDSEFGDANRNLAMSRKSDAVSRGFSELIAPIQGAAQTRSRVMHFRNDYGVGIADSRFDAGFVRTIEIELPEDVAPLSWNLDQRAADAIISNAPGRVAAAVGTIMEWWTAGPAAHPAARTAPTP